MSRLFCLSILLLSVTAETAERFVCQTVDAADSAEVQRVGTWYQHSFRYAVAASMATQEDGAALEYKFTGRGIAVRLGGNNVPAYGPPNLGTVLARVDGGKPITIHPHSSPREVVLAEKLGPGPHLVRIEHRANGEQTGCRIEGFQIWNHPTGSLAFQVNGDANAFLVDARAILRQGGGIVRNAIVRNWLSGRCSLTGLSPGEYELEIHAAGWQSAARADIQVRAHETTAIDPVYLRREPSTVIQRFRFPALNRPAIRKPGESLRARFLGFDTEINHVELIRQVGPAVISRRVKFTEDKAVSHYYDREVIVHLPEDMPAGLYDLNVQVTGGRRTGTCRSPRSVHVVREWPQDPVLVAFGHLDTSGQYQAEYLERIADMANLMGADLVLQSTSVNPAYISGALARLDIPHITNFGNHQFYGHEQWYGDPVNRIDFGPDISVLNFGHLWFDRDSIAKADRLLDARPDAGMKIINAFESNAPVDFLNRHQICLIHDAHGLGQKVKTLTGTETLRVGKVNATSFRVLRFRNNRVVSATYHGHETKPIPFGRDTSSPLKITHSTANDGTTRRITSTITNQLLDPYPNGRVTWVLPQGDYHVTGGRLESNYVSDDSRYSVVTARVDVPAKSKITLSLSPTH